MLYHLKQLMYLFLRHAPFPPMILHSPGSLAQDFRLLGVFSSPPRLSSVPIDRQGLSILAACPAYHMLLVFPPRAAMPQSVPG